MPHRRLLSLILVTVMILAVTPTGCAGEGGASTQSGQPDPTVPTGTPGGTGDGVVTQTTTTTVIVERPVASFADVADRVLPSVVFILAETDRRNVFGAPVTVAGSGVILRSDGYILTNKHVVEDGQRVEVTLHDRRVYPVTDIFMDDLMDLAVVKIDLQDLPAMSFANPDSIRVGEPVAALGHALGLSPFEGGASVTSGIVSNLGRSFSIEDTAYYDLIQTDASINPGNSGGALVNVSGELVGINSAGAPRAEGVGYAINVGTARHVFEDLVQFGRPVHPYLGMTAEDITRDTAPVVACTCLAGAVVVTLEEGSPAQSAGLQPGDIIVTFAGNEIESAADLIKFLWRQDIGSTAEVAFFRGETTQTVNITLTERPPGSAI